MARFCVEFVHKHLSLPIVRLSRPISQTTARWMSEEAEGEENVEERQSTKPKRLEVDPDTSVRYLHSDAYQETYGADPVWHHYRRNFIGGMPPKTRKTCIRQGEISTGSPCPICRDEYLVLGMKNVKLLEQFISPQTGQVFDSKRTGLCQTQHKKLLIAVETARNHGYLEGPVPFRRYDYSQYLEKL